MGAEVVANIMILNRAICLILCYLNGEGNDNSNCQKNAQVFVPGKSHGQRSLAGYSPWGRKGLEAT